MILDGETIKIASAKLSEISTRLITQARQLVDRNNKYVNTASLHLLKRDSSHGWLARWFHVWRSNSLLKQNEHGREELKKLFDDVDEARRAIILLAAGNPQLAITVLGKELARMIGCRINVLEVADGTDRITSLPTPDELELNELTELLKDSVQNLAVS